MGSKAFPGEFDCIGKAEIDEEMFTLLARDPIMPKVVRYWVSERVRLGLNRPDDRQVIEALKCARLAELWRDEHPPDA